MEGLTKLSYYFNLPRTMDSSSSWFSYYESMKDLISSTSAIFLMVFVFYLVFFRVIFDL